MLDSMADILIQDTLQSFEFTKENGHWRHKKEVQKVR